MDTTPTTTNGVQTAGSSAARAAMVAQLEASGKLRPGLVREALLAVRREVLMPQAYVRRTKPDEEPRRWDQLDWNTPADRDELLTVLYSGNSVLIQHDGERILGRPPGPRSGSLITSMSSVIGPTSDRLQELDLRPGQRVLDIGTGAGFTAAVACSICGDDGVVTLDRDPHLTEAAQVRLADHGFRPATVTGDGEHGWPELAPYDRTFVSYTVPYVPRAWADQLAPGGKALVNVTGLSPSWPGLAVITRTPGGRLEAELRPVDTSHLPGHGVEQRRFTPEFRDRVLAAEGGRTFRTHQAPPPDEARGLWLALDHLSPGLVRLASADHLAIAAPACGSWLTARPDDRDNGDWLVTSFGPRNIWEELHTVAARWRTAGEPAVYRLHFGTDGEQWISGGSGTELSWQLPKPDAHPLEA